MRRSPRFSTDTLVTTLDRGMGADAPKAGHRRMPAPPNRACSFEGDGFRAHPPRRAGRGLAAASATETDRRAHARNSSGSSRSSGGQLQYEPIVCRSPVLVG